MNDTRLAMVGDVMLGRGVNEILHHASVNYPWGKLHGQFTNIDKAKLQQLVKQAQ